MIMYYFRLGFVILLLTMVAVSVHALTAQERLFTAAEQGDAAAVKAALKAGAKVNGKDAEGWTALLMATSAGRLEAVKALLAAGANVNAASSKGETPLMGAALSGNEAIAKLLLAKGASKTAKTKSGLTAADFAEKKGNPQLASLLRDGKAPAATAKAAIPSSPIGEPAKIVLPSGLTLFDWISAAQTRIDKGELDAVLTEGSGYLRQYGPHKSLMQVLDKASGKLADSITFESKDQATAAIPKLVSALTAGDWPKLLIKLGNAYHMLGQFDKARATYTKWLTSTAPNDPLRQQVVAWQTLVNQKTTLEEQALWDKIQASGSTAAMKDYIGNYPNGRYAASVREKLAAAQAREEEALWQSVKDSMDADQVQRYLNQYPKGRYAAAAQEKLPAIAKFEAEIKSRTFKDCPDCPEMLAIPAGSFEMGSNEYSDEKPVHRVNVPAFAISRTEVTQGQWRAVMGSNPSSFKDCGENCPVENVSWEDAKAFVKKLSKKTGKSYRLPSEAEWEYAARAGTTTKYWWGDQASHEYMNYGKDECCAGFASGRDQWVNTAPVGQFSANAFGLRDMNGNVWEWVEDCWHDSYNGAPTDGSAWTSGGDCGMRVLRGGSWGYEPQVVRSANRFRYTAGFRDYYDGFRLARTPD